MIVEKINLEKELVWVWKEAVNDELEFNYGDDAKSDDIKKMRNKLNLTDDIIEKFKNKWTQTPWKKEAYLTHPGSFVVNDDQSLLNEFLAMDDCETFDGLEIEIETRINLWLIDNCQQMVSEIFKGLKETL